MRTDREECRYRIVAPSCNQFIWLSLNCLLANSFHLKDMMLFQRWGMRLWFNWHFVSQGVAIVKRSKSMNLVSQSWLFDHWQCCRWFLAGRDRQSCLGQSLGREENRGREPVSSCCVFLLLTSPLCLYSSFPKSPQSRLLMVWCMISTALKRCRDHWINLTLHCRHCYSWHEHHSTLFLQ